MDLIWDMVSLGGGSKYVLICTPKVWGNDFGSAYFSGDSTTSAAGYVCKRVSTCNHKYSWESKGTPPMPPPPGNKALLRDYLPLVSLNKALLGPYFLGGVA